MTDAMGYLGGAAACLGLWLAGLHLGGKAARGWLRAAHAGCGLAALGLALAVLGRNGWRAGTVQTDAVAAACVAGALGGLLWARWQALGRWRGLVLIAHASAGAAAAAMLLAWNG